jgi:hypothetical protein
MTGFCRYGHDVDMFVSYFGLLWLRRSRNNVTTNSRKLQCCHRFLRLSQTPYRCLRPLGLWPKLQINVDSTPSRPSRLRRVDNISASLTLSSRSTHHWISHRISNHQQCPQSSSYPGTFPDSSRSVISHANATTEALTPSSRSAAASLLLGSGSIERRRRRARVHRRVSRHSRGGSGWCLRRRVGEELRASRLESV